MPSILVQMGGAKALDALVPDFYDRVLNDETLKPFFVHSTKEKLVGLQTHFLIKLLNGGTGLSAEMRGKMQVAHQRLGLTDHHFDVMEVYFKKSISSFEYSEEIIKGFMSLIATSRPLILGYKAQVKSVTTDMEGNEKLIIILDEEVKDLYVRLGGRYSVSLIVAKMYGHLTHDPEIKAFFSNHNVPLIQGMFEKFLVAGLTETLTDEMQDRMRAAHGHISLTNHHFDLFKRFLIKSTSEFEIPEKTCTDLGHLMERFRTKVLPHVAILGDTTSIESDRFFSVMELYDNVGGETAIELVVNNFLHHVVEHATLASYFTGVDMKKQFILQKKFLTLALKEKELPHNSFVRMREAHKKFDLDNADFDAFKGLMKESFFKLELMTPEMWEVIGARLEAYREAIVASSS